jgi:Phosphomannose isomerase
MQYKIIAEKALEQGRGILRLTPTWVPRSFCRPGRRIKLHPDDYYVLGLERGGIDERWFASTTHADNGLGTPEDEGLSYIVADNEGKERVLLKNAVEYLKGQIIGNDLWDKYQRWPMFSKFFDNMGPLPHHIHHRKEHAERVGQQGKPEMYFFPSQLNNHGGEFPFTFFGFNPETTIDEVKNCLENFKKGDNKLVDLSRCYKLTLDTGWDVPPGVLHAPGSLCTYEPQFASDVYAMYQSVLYGGQCVPEELLWKDTPQEEIGNIDYLLEVIDWELNMDPEFHKNRFMIPMPVRDIATMKKEGYIEEWICYNCKEVCAKRLTVLPGQTVTIKDGAAYGFILLQGRGKCGVWDIETPALIRYGQLTNDEFFVTEDAAKKGVTIQNQSETEPIVMLKHFSENPDLLTI